MLSPGTGLQHFESLTKQLSIPFTTIPDFEAFTLFLGLLIVSNMKFSKV